ncbi:hypothetical protein ABZT00_36610, partial [Streptomyces sp. NPDC005486]
MHSVLDLALDCVVGALGKTTEPSDPIDPTDPADPTEPARPAGVTLHRSPERGRAQLADSAFDFSSAVPSGVRLEMLTDATELELDARLRVVLPPGMPSAGSVFDLVVDGELREPVVATEQSLIFLDPATGALEARPAAVLALFHTDNSLPFDWSWLGFSHFVGV